MSNEVEIVVSGKDRSGPAFASARAREKAFAAETKATLGKAGSDAGKAMGDGIVRGADGKLRDARGRFVKGGQELGDGIADGVKDGTDRGKRIVSGFTGSVLSSFNKLGPGMQAAIIGGVAAAPAAASAAAGGITLAIGGAITGIGIASAAQSVKVRREWSETSRELKAELADVAQPMERSTIKAAGVARTTFGRLKPYLATFFKDSQPAVDRFVKSIGNGVASLGPALQPLERGYSAVLDRLSARGPAIFGNLEESLANIGDIAEEHADDFASMIEGASALTVKVTELGGALADVWGWMTKVKGAGDVLDIDPTVGVLNVLGSASDKAKEAIDATGHAVDVLTGSARDGAAGLRDLKASLEELNGPALDAAEAQIQVESAIDRASESVRKNGRTLDVNTEKGRANKDALIDIARAAQGHVAAMQAEGASTSAIAEKYGQYRSQLVHAARQAGMTKAAAERLADAWMKTPDEVVTHARGDMSDLEAKIAAAKRKLKDPGLTRPERAHIRAEISDLQRKVSAAKSALASVRGKTVFVDLITRYTTIGHGTVLAPGRAHGGIIGGLGGVRRFAQGGVSGSGSSLALVGEQGPELVRLPVGSGVTGAGQTRALMGGGSRGGGFGSISMAFRPGGQTGGGGGLGDSVREVLSFREALEKLTSSIFGQERALSGYEAAWDAAGKSLKENGRHLSLTTEKGRENRSALLSLAEAAQEVVIAMHEQGRASSTITAKMKEQRSEFISIARRMGLSKSSASDLATKYGLTTSAVSKALAGGKAGGGPAGGVTLVGERGPELVRLPFGSQVTSANQTAAMVAASGGPTQIILEVRGGDAEFSRFMAQWIRKFVHAKGGNVQLAFGSGRS